MDESWGNEVFGELKPNDIPIEDVSRTSNAIAAIVESVC